MLSSLTVERDQVELSRRCMQSSRKEEQTSVRAAPGRVSVSEGRCDAPRWHATRAAGTVAADQLLALSQWQSREGDLGPLRLCCADENMESRSASTAQWCHIGHALRKCTQPTAPKLSCMP